MLAFWDKHDIFEDKNYEQPWCITMDGAARIYIELPGRFPAWRKILRDIFGVMIQDCASYVWRKKTVGKPSSADDSSEYSEHFKDLDGVFPLLMGKLKGLKEDGGGYRFPWHSLDVLLELCLANMYHARSVRNDLFIVPETGKGVIYLSHHDAIIIRAGDEVLERLYEMYPDAK